MRKSKPVFFAISRKLLLKRKRILFSKNSDLLFSKISDLLFSKSNGLTYFSSSKRIYPVKTSLTFLLVFLITASCSVLRRTAVEEPDDLMDLNTLCDSTQSYKSLYINKISAIFHLDGENYDARLSLYYIPDSVIYFTAVNSGFEIIRGAVYSDSTLIINRLEKSVFIQKYNGFGYKPLVEFTDLEILFNRSLLCESIGNLTKDEHQIIADFSTQNINKKITYSANDLSLNKFEFFQKKTGEYIVGNINNQGIVSILSNYIMDDLELSAEGGNVEFDKELSINLSVNKAKYAYFYL